MATGFKNLTVYIKAFALAIDIYLNHLIQNTEKYK